MFRNMSEQTKESHTVADLVAESERIRDRAATIMAEIQAILQEMAQRKAKESQADKGRIGGDR